MGLDELDLSTNLELLESGPLVCEDIKSPIPNMDCENNYVDKEFESCKNKCKKGCKEQTIKIRPMHTFCLILEYVVCVVLDTCRSFLINEIL